MNRMIFCCFFKKQSKGMDFQIYPGQIGKRIYKEISKKAWNAWLLKQTMIINEEKLSMINIKDRQKLEKEMIRFLFKEDV